MTVAARVGEKRNTAKTTTVSDGSGRLPWPASDRPGRMHDQAAPRTEGIAEQLRTPPQVAAMVDEGHRGPADGFPDQVQAPPRKPKHQAPSTTGREVRLAGGAPTPVLADLRGTHHRRGTRGTEATAAPALPRPSQPRDARRHRRPGLRPRSPQAHPAPDEHRTGPRPASRLLITHQPAATQAHRSRAVSRSEPRLAGTPRTVLGRTGPPLSRPGRQRMFPMRSVPDGRNPYALAIRARPEATGRPRTKASEPNAATSPHEERKWTARFPRLPQSFGKSLTMPQRMHAHETAAAPAKN